MPQYRHAFIEGGIYFFTVIPSNRIPIRTTKAGMKNILFLWLIFIASLIVGCSNNNHEQNLNPTETQLLSPTPVHISTSNPTDVPTPAELPKVITPPFEQDLSKSTQAGITQECNHLIESKQNIQTDKGIIAFETHNPQTKYQISFYNLENNETNTIQQDFLSDLVITPNRKMFAFLNAKNHTLEIYSNELKPIRSLKMDKERGGISKWIDDKTLLLVQDKPIVSQPNFSEYPRSIIVLDPFSGSTQIESTDYPNIDRADRNFGWYQYGTTVYDPTFSRVVYPGTIMGNDGEIRNGVILYDIPQKKKLAEIPTPTWAGRPPIWSPDGSKFVIMGESELLIIGADGKISNVSNMNPSFNPETPGRLNVLPLFYNWSPDGKRIAMWLKQNNSITLAILNPLAGQIIDTCIQAGFDPKDVTTWPYPVWSPDGKKLVIAANYRSQDKSFDVVLVKLTENTHTKVVSNSFPVGWMAAP